MFGSAGNTVRQRLSRAKQSIWNTKTNWRLKVRWHCTYNFSYRIYTAYILREVKSSPLSSVIETTFWAAELLSAVMGTTVLWLIIQSTVVRNTADRSSAVQKVLSITDGGGGGGGAFPSLRKYIYSLIFNPLLPVLETCRRTLTKPNILASPATPPVLSGSPIFQYGLDQIFRYSRHSGTAISDIQVQLYQIFRYNSIRYSGTALSDIQVQLYQIP